jgi:hypothetical protein
MSGGPAAAAVASSSSSRANDVPAKGNPRAIKKLIILDEPVKIDGKFYSEGLLVMQVSE